MMTREAKIGLMMVAVLVGVFGFLVYKRIHRPMELRADQRILNEESSTTLQDDFPPPRAEISLPERKPHSSKLAREAKAIVREAEEFAEDAVEEIDLFAHAKVKREKPPIPNVFSDEDEEDVKVVNLEPPRAEPARRSEFRSRKAEPAKLEKVEEESPFDDSPSVLPPSNIELASSSDESESDPFEQPTAHDRRHEQDSEKPDHHRHQELPADDAFQPPAEPRHQARQIAEEEEQQVEAPPRRAYADSDPFEATPRGRRETAPHRLQDEVAPSHAPNHPVATAHGPKYTIQPNDNFWIISRKRYGAGRFYMALAEHNQNVIPDPKRMMPGVVISTPDVEHLERDYASIIPKPPVADVVVPVGAVHTPKRDDGPAGFFVSREGHPMYRVGDKDTLTEIAKVHLNRSTRWVQILEMNRNVIRDGNELKIGMVLRLPADASRVRVVDVQRDYR